MDQLRHIWQLCDVTRDGALDLAEFTAAMHLVVLRRNNIPIPSALPTCLQPQFLYKSLGLPQKEAPEADLLQLESDNDNQEPVAELSSVVKNDYQRMVSSTYEEIRSSGGKSNAIMNKSSTLPKNHYSQHQRVGEGDGDSNSGSNFSLNNKPQATNKNVISNSSNRSSSNSPPSQTVTDGAAGDAQNSNKEWTKFAESPTSNVSSPGPKPVNVTTNIIDPSHVIHPVPLRVTPVGMEVADDEAARTFRKADSLVYESGVMKVAGAALDREGASPRHPFKKQSSYVQHQRDSLPTDLRAIQRPHPKKPASKNIGAIPLPPETNHVAGNNGSNGSQVTITGSTIVVSNKKEVPPLPPPRFVFDLTLIYASFNRIHFRPHRHARSSSLDLQRIKLSTNNASQDQEASAQPPELPPPRISDKSFKMASVDAYVEPAKRSDESFADFTQFPDTNVGFN